MSLDNVNLCHVLEVCCPTVNALEVYIQHNGIDANHPAVVTRRNQLLSNQLITDSDTFQLLTYCCNTLDDLSKIVVEYRLDRNDLAVRAREAILQVS